MFSYRTQYPIRCTTSHSTENLNGCLSAQGTSEIKIHLSRQLQVLTTSNYYYYYNYNYNKMAIDAATFKFETPQFDPRFPNQNQSKHCAQSYIDYHKCVNVKGEEFEPCQIFFKTFTSLCPLAWVEKWDDQRAAGTFPVNLDA